MFSLLPFYFFCMSTLRRFLNIWDLRPIFSFHNNNILTVDISTNLNLLDILFMKAKGSVEMLSFGSLKMLTMTSTIRININTDEILDFCCWCFGYFKIIWGLIKIAFYQMSIHVYVCDWFVICFDDGKFVRRFIFPLFYTKCKLKHDSREMEQRNTQSTNQFLNFRIWSHRFLWKRFEPFGIFNYSRLNTIELSFSTNFYQTTMKTIYTKKYFRKVDL